MPTSRPKNFQFLLKEHFSRGGEVAKPEEGNKLTEPATGNSGFTVGWVQRDLARAPSDLKKVVEFLKRTPNLAGQAGKLTSILGKKDSQLTEADRDFLNDHKTTVNKRLGSEEGRAVLEKISAAQARLLEQKVYELARDAGTGAKAFLNSTEGRLRIADYMNQFGTGNEKLARSSRAGRSPSTTARPKSGSTAR